MKNVANCLNCIKFNGKGCSVYGNNPDIACKECIEDELKYYITIEQFDKMVELGNVNDEDEI